MKRHIITPEGKEIASTKYEWNRMPKDWRQLAIFLECENCPNSHGEKVDHAARQKT